MNRYRVHVLYEHGTDLRPFGSAYIRLLRPLTHPTLARYVEVTWGPTYDGQEANAVIVDRLWRPDISLDLVMGLHEQVHRTKGRLIYALDDDFLSLTSEQQPWFTGTHRQVVQFMLTKADGLLVTTRALAERFSTFNRRIGVLPNALDERLLLAGTRPLPLETPFGRRRIVIGYMGTPSHDDDLMMIVPALKKFAQRHSSEFELQIIGGISRNETFEALMELPVRIISPQPEEVEYPLFMLWFSSHAYWDIGLAPLRDTFFNYCKSDIKFLDYCSIGAVGIYTKGPAYCSSVQHMKTGWLVENDIEMWNEALEVLFANDELRLQLATNASRYLRSERILARVNLRWLELLDCLLA